MDAGTRVLSVRDSDSTATVTSGDTVTITYNDCNSSLNGTITFNVVTLDIRQNRVYGFGGSVSADLSGRRPASSFTLQLEFEFEFTDDAQNTERVVLTEGDYTWTTTTTAEPPESVTVTATGLTINELFTAIGDYTISVSGRVDDEGLGGSFEFAPRQAYTGSIGNYPDAGSVKFTGSQSALVVAANSDPYYQRQRANYGVNATSTADPETSDRIRWREFQDGFLFGVFEPYDARFDPDPRYDQAPYFRGLGTNPLNPRTGDDLQAYINAYDPEGEALEFTYAWFRNGERLDGRNGPTLSAAEHVKGDVISLQVTATDGRLVSTLRRDKTIRDTPPTFSLLSMPPAVVASGETVSFQVGFDDVDGDPLPESSYQVDYGPGGLEIDADGRVTWTAGPLMFDRAMDYHWGVSAPGLAGSSFSGVIRVEDLTRDYPLMRTGVFGPPRVGNMAMGDFDSDGIDEMLIIGFPRYVVYELQWNGEDYEQTWAYPFTFDNSTLGVTRSRNETVAHSVAAGDTDGDGLHEIFLGTSGLVLKLDGEHRRVVSVAEFADGCGPLEYVDLDADGHGELICFSAGAGNGGIVLVLDAQTLAVKWRSAHRDHGRGFTIGNVDNDAADEIVTAGGFVYDGRTGALDWSRGQRFGTEVDTGDIDGDGTREIIGIDGDFVRVYNARSQSMLLEFSQRRGTSRTFMKPYALEVADVEGDGLDEVIFGLDPVISNLATISVYRYDAATNSLRSWATMDDRVPGQSQNSAFIRVGNVDDDDQIEYIRSAGSIIVTGLDLEVAWNGLASHFFGGPFGGGLDATVAPGEQRLVFSAIGYESQWRSETGPRILALDADTGAYSASAMNIGEDDYRAVPIQVTDYGLDGVDEVFLIKGYDDHWHYAVWDIVEDRQRWRSPTDTRQAASIRKDDVTGDGRDDFIVDLGLSISVYDLANESLVWESTNSGNDFTLGDLDADGNLELITKLYDPESRRSLMHVYGKSSEATYELRTSEIIGRSIDVDGFAVGDSDGDGEAEIFVLTHDLEVLRLDADLKELSRFTIAGIEPGRAEQVTGIYLDPPGAGRRNLILTTSAADRIIGVDPINGSLVWKSPPLMGAVTANGLRHTDIDGDGEPNLVLATEFGVYVTR